VRCVHPGPFRDRGRRNYPEAVPNGEGRNGDNAPKQVLSAYREHRSHRRRGIGNLLHVRCQRLGGCGPEPWIGVSTGCRRPMSLRKGDFVEGGEIKSGSGKGEKERA
jgi:hypothetical protein